MVMLTTRVLSSIHIWNALRKCRSEDIVDVGADSIYRMAFKNWISLEDGYDKRFAKFMRKVRDRKRKM